MEKMRKRYQPVLDLNCCDHSLREKDIEQLELSVGVRKPSAILAVFASGDLQPLKAYRITSATGRERRLALLSDRILL